MKKLSIIIIAVLLLVCKEGDAIIKLPGIVSSNMVLQRDTTIKIWGWANPYEKITISASWIKHSIKIEADKQGKWSADINTTMSKAPQSISLKSKESDITLNNILFGEVWLCSGQSNMRQALKGYTGQPTFGGNKAIAFSNNKNIRLFSVKEKASITPLDSLVEYSGWLEASPESVKDFSAVGYLFAEKLNKILDTPIGVIMSSWGGSKVQAWMSFDAVNAIEKVDLSKLDITKQPNQKPTLLYNSMIKPLIPYTIKGALWYQGESNRNQYKQYEKLFPAMVKDWRYLRNQGKFPFYFVQIAPFTYKDGNSALIRESQLKCAQTIPNSGIAILTDIGDERSIHPPKKEEVAERLLYIALNKTYGYTKIDCEGPIYQSLEVKDSTIILNFKKTQEGLYSPEENLSGFEIAGADHVFYPADAKIIKRRILQVSSNKVEDPIAVRYAWKNWVVGSLFDGNLLPASSFRTDDWEE